MQCLTSVPSSSKFRSSMAISGETTARYWAQSSIFAPSMPRADVPGFGPAWFRLLVPSRWPGWRGMAGGSEPRFDLGNHLVHCVDPNRPMMGQRGIRKRQIWLGAVRLGYDHIVWISLLASFSRGTINSSDRIFLRWARHCDVRLALFLGGCRAKRNEMMLPVPSSARLGPSSRRCT
jgi:hypothetical protein